MAAAQAGVHLQPSERAVGAGLRRVSGRIGEIPPVEFETAYYDSLEAPNVAVGLN